MRIFFLTSHSHLPIFYGGSELSTDNLARRCVLAGHEPAVLSTLSHTLSWFAIKSRIRAKFLQNGFSVDRICGYPVYRSWEPEAYLRKASQSERPDVVVIQAGEQNRMAHAALAAQVPVVYYLRDVEYNFQDKDLPILERSQFIANSKFTARVFRERTGLDSVIIPPLVEAENYRNDAPGDSVLFVNPHPKKGLDVALILAEQCPDIPFIFVENWPVPPEQKKMPSRAPQSFKILNG